MPPEPASILGWLRAAPGDRLYAIEARHFWRRRRAWLMLAICGGSVLLTLAASLLSKAAVEVLRQNALLAARPDFLRTCRSLTLSLAELDGLIVQVLVVIFLARAFAVEFGRNTLEPLAMTGVASGRLLACRFLARMHGFWVCMLLYAFPLFLKRVMLCEATGAGLERLALLPLEWLVLLATVVLWGAVAVMCGTLARSFWAVVLALVLTLFAVPIPVLTVTLGASGLYALAAGISLQDWFKFLTDFTDPGSFGMYLTVVISSLASCLLLAWACLALAAKRLEKILQCPEEFGS